MTYKEIINRFRTVTEEHLILQDFGYGQLSDLKTQSQLGPEEQGADYPYLFLLPATSNRQGPVMNYSFNMVVMDMARGEEGDLYDNYITIQSQCQQYIDDVLARLYYYYKDQPEINLTNISYTPFKEKYQDDLAGMTASITIQVPTPINECIAPFAPDVPVTPIVADFSANDTTPAVGDFVTFTDLSTGDPTEWSWLFENGTPATSILQNPVIQYNTIGNYDVSLTASKLDSSDSITKTDYIEVPAPAGELLFEWENSGTYTIDPNLVNPPARFAYNAMITDPNFYWQTVQIKNTLPVGSYKLVVDQRVGFGFNPPNYVVPAEPVLRKQGTGILEYIPATNSTGWPTVFAQPPVNWYAEYFFDIVEGDALTTEDIFIQDTPLQGDRFIVPQIGGNIKLYTA